MSVDAATRRFALKAARIDTLKAPKWWISRTLEPARIARRRPANADFRHKGEVLYTGYDRQSQYFCVRNHVDVKLINVSSKSQCSRFAVLLPKGCGVYLPVEKTNSI